MAANPLRIPITNVYAGGDYTAEIRLGSRQQTANVILDTGSSTLAVVPKVYDIAGDATKQTTGFAQDVLYGTGGWTGPVLQTRLGMGTDPASVSVDAYLAVAIDDERRGFGGADGIMGLAYNVLNNAYDLGAYLAQQGHEPAVTYPWPFKVKPNGAALQQFLAFLTRVPERDLPPYFSALTDAGVERNVFAFYTLRSMPSTRSGRQLATDPLNHGWFVMGTYADQHDLYDGEFLVVDVVADQYFNTDLMSVQVGARPAVAIVPPPANVAKTLGSNSIVDSGTNSLVLARDVLVAVLDGLVQTDARFEDALRRREVDTATLGLDDWPDITFNLRGPDNRPVPLVCRPTTYWQVDFPQPGKAVFLIGDAGMPQSILGLPLMNNYYTVFDRTDDPYGVIRFAPIKAPA
jgi:hypothetical protein